MADTAASSRTIAPTTQHAGSQPPSTASVAPQPSDGRAAAPGSFVSAHTETLTREDREVLAQNILDTQVNTANSSMIRIFRREHYQVLRSLGEEIQELSNASTGGPRDNVLMLSKIKDYGQVAIQFQGLSELRAPSDNELVDFYDRVGIKDTADREANLPLWSTSSLDFGFVEQASLPFGDTVPLGHLFFSGNDFFMSRHFRWLFSIAGAGPDRRRVRRTAYKWLLAVILSFMIGVFVALPLVLLTSLDLTNGQSMGIIIPLGVGLITFLTFREMSEHTTIVSVSAYLAVLVAVFPGFGKGCM